MANEVFISYSTKDKEIADALCLTLEQNGIRCWIAPRDIVPGVSWAGNIVRALRDCALMVLVYSKESNMSQQVANEVDKAFTNNKTIIPFLVDDTPMNEDFDYYLSRKHWLVAYNDYKKAIDLLVRTIVSHPAVAIARTSTPEPQPPVPQPTVAESPVAEFPAPAVAGHAISGDFELACVRDGVYRYFNKSEWSAVTDKSAYDKKGVVLTDFIVALDDLTSERLTWNEAMTRYGSQLPDKAQAAVIGKNRDSLNDAIRAFGGMKAMEYAKNYYPSYWLKTEKNSSAAWYVNMVSGNVNDAGKTDTYRARAVIPVAESHTSAVAGHAIPGDFELACVRDGKFRYFTATEWDAVTDKSAYEKKGVVLTDFIVALDDLTSESTWNEAMTRYGLQLPTKEQGIIIAKNRYKLNKAMKVFGGRMFDIDMKGNHWPYYWTMTEYKPSNAWFFNMYDGTVYNYTKTHCYRARAVIPLPAH